jgi:hypothetical protein
VTPAFRRTFVQAGALRIHFRTAGTGLPAQCERLVDGHFPDVSPRTDGAHLLAAWFMLRDRRLWLPWHRRTAAGIPRDGTPELGGRSLHAELVELMKCGEGPAAAAAVEADGALRQRFDRLAAAALLPADASQCAVAIHRWSSARDEDRP